MGQQLILLMLGACLYTLAAPPYEWGGAAWLALAPLFLVIRDKAPWAGFTAGLLYGVFFCVGIAYWVYLAISAYFPFPFPLDLLCTFLSYSFFVGSYTGLAAALSCVLMRHGRRVLCYTGVPALWVIGEFARSSLLSGFSWELLGYTQYRSLTLIQIADVTGVYGLSFLLALSGYVAAEVVSALPFLRSTVRKPQYTLPPLPWRGLAALAAVILLTLGYGALRLREPWVPATAPAVRLALVQGNVPSTQRWSRVHYTAALLKYASLTSQGVTWEQPDLVVWPEFALGFYPEREPLLRARLSQLTQQLDAFLLFGAPRVEESGTGTRYFNSAYLLAPEGTLLEVYDKIRLLPFAEYRPRVLAGLLPHSLEYPSEFTAGQRSTVFFLPQSTFGVIICYEATYPHLARQLVRDGAQFLVNISNDTWLATDAAVAQHFSMAVFRAVENRRYLVRATTAGISGFVDPLGRSYQLSVGKEGVVLGEVFPRNELTVYAQYGDWFVLTCAGFVLIALMSAARANCGAIRLLVVDS